MGEPLDPSKIAARFYDSWSEGCPWRQHGPEHLEGVITRLLASINGEATVAAETNGVMVRKRGSIREMYISAGWESR